MIEISKEDYRRIAALLRERIGNAEWFNGTVAIPPPACEKHGERATDGEDMASGEKTVHREEPAREHWRLVLTAIVYRRREDLPEGPRRPIADVVPVWWEFSTDGTLNDFSFAELRPYVVDYE